MQICRAYWAATILEFSIRISSSSTDRAATRGRCRAMGRHCFHLPATNWTLTLGCSAVTSRLSPAPATIPVPSSGFRCGRRRRRYRTPCTRRPELPLCWETLNSTPIWISFFCATWRRSKSTSVVEVQLTPCWGTAYRSVQFRIFRSYRCKNLRFYVF